MGCEFGLFQRACGAEPLGLLRWAEMTPRNLIEVLNARFEGVGTPENTELVIHQTPNGPVYISRDRNFLMSMHTFVKAKDVEETKFFSESCRRIQYLRDKLMDDLRSGAKIFVYKVTARNLTDEELYAIHAAMRAYGDTWLLALRYACDAFPNGTVRALKPGLMAGYIDRFNVSRAGELLSLPIDSWLAICRAAKALRESEVAVDLGLDRTP